MSVGHSLDSRMIMGMNIDLRDESNMNNFVAYVLNCCKEKIREKRLEIVSLLDGDVFYNIDSWPKELRLILWKKPLSDKETCKLILFLVGNGCPPLIAYKWIITSTYWGREKTRKRWEQIRWINLNMERNMHYWFYYDMFHSKHLYLNGDERQL
ncbi:Hypothetical predicted protein [Paramuricea clavata]|uniref:Uncharacterized protein n=1 Tax=Paramuricea clavata TaxID=317549 RepID=A0A6S7HBV9_PARCT|nr:Hypothetical predicted protein [Paramuricea clavata]